MNRFKGLNLVDRVPEELWMEVHNIVQEVVTKTIPKKKKCKKVKCLSGEALQIAVKRREVKSKGEKERYKHLNAECQRIARRDKKAFLSDQCKEREENNRMGKTRDLFKKIRDTKGTFHAKMGSIKDRNEKDLTETEEIRKPSSVINAKKERKTTEWERLEISSRKLDIPREYFMQHLWWIHFDVWQNQYNIVK